MTEPRVRTAALVVAAGEGRRFGGETPKQYRLLAGRPVVACSVRALLDAPGVDGVMVVIHPGHEAHYRAACDGLPLLPSVTGGATRQQSVRLGLERLAAYGTERVLIHDAARPLVSAGLIGRALAALERHAGAVPALPVTDTLKQAAAGAGEPAVIERTVGRAGLWRVQTPQAFRFDDILAAHRAHADREATDDAMLIEWAGGAVALVPGEERNMKITGPEDLITAERLIGGETRVGTGFDVHRFGPGNQVMLCGVAIAHEAGLVGHSDADVGLHALTDAILGAVAKGDIGEHFPPSDPQWRGADSARFLKAAAEEVARLGGRITALDVTLICERPKIGPHRAAMTERIAAIVGIERARVSVKATTTEGLGFTGRAEGIAAQAVATVMLPG
jgi:2-C-methyl-D-erythritol 4-phosphate cytidylyltransferase/2-C-methyl-D-erythritol 2,4-cyclodiphosphate synthase